MRIVMLLIFLASTGCTLNFTIATDYASQNASDGEISETVTSEDTTTPTVDTTLDVPGEVL